MLAVPYFRPAWLLALPAALAVWRVRTAAKAGLLFCGGALLLCCASLSLTATAATAAPAAQESSHAATHASSNFAIADFDSDRRPDLATAEIERSDSRFAHYLIHLQFGAGPGQSVRYGEFIGLTGAFGLPQISAVDVNGDHAMDLVVTAVGQPQPIAILLNDGRGKFSLANPRDYPAAVLDSPWRWGAGERSVSRRCRCRSDQDAARPKPQNARQAFVQHDGLAESRFSTSRGFPPDPLRSSLLGRAPPQLA